MTNLETNVPEVLTRKAVRFCSRATVFTTSLLENLITRRALKTQYCYCFDLHRNEASIVVRRVKHNGHCHMSRTALRALSLQNH